MSEFHRFKEEQFSQAAKFLNGCPDPIGLAPKTVTLITE
jgi:hypothetical protein